MCYGCGCGVCCWKLNKHTRAKQLHTKHTHKIAIYIFRQLISRLYGWNKWDSNGSNRHNCLNNFICEYCAQLNLETNFNKGNQFWREGLLNVTHLFIFRPINYEWLMIVKVNDPNCICWHSIKPLFLYFIIESDVSYLQNRHTHPHDESWFWHLSISESFVKSMYVIVMQPLLSWRIGTFFVKI